MLLAWLHMQGLRGGSDIGGLKREGGQPAAAAAPDTDTDTATETAPDRDRAEMGLAMRCSRYLQSYSSLSAVLS